MRKMKKFCMFTKEQDESLIELVSQNPPLYDPSNPSYKDIILRDRTWTQIGEAVNRSAEDCKTRWRSIRDLYHKKKKGGKGGLWCTETNKAKWEYADQMAFMNNFYFDRKTMRKVNYDVEESTVQSEQGLKCDENSTIQSESTIVVEEEMEISPDLNTTTSQSRGEMKKRLVYIEPVHATRRKSDNIDGNLFKVTKRRKEERNELLRNVLCVAKRGSHPIKLFFDSMAETVMSFPPSLQAEAKLKVCQVITNIECQLADKSQASSMANYL